MGRIAEWIAKRALKRVMKQIRKEVLNKEQVVALAKKHRRHDEEWLYEFSQRPQMGWCAKTDIDDLALLYVQTRYKSSYLEGKRNGN